MNGLWLVYEWWMSVELMNHEEMMIYEKFSFKNG